MLNYSTHVIEGFQKNLPALYQSAPLSAKTIELLMQWLGQAAKFVFPHGSDMVALEGLDASYFENLRLPFPICALEIYLEPTGRLITDGNLAESASSRRIALAIHADLARKADIWWADRIAPEAEILVFSFYYYDQTKIWALAPSAGGLTQVDPEEIVPLTQAPDQAMVQALMDANIITKKSNSAPIHLLTVLPEFRLAMQRELGKEATATRIGLDLRDEVSAVIEFSLLMNCANVKSQEVQASAALNKKRIKTGKVPFFSHHLIVVEENQSKHNTDSPGDTFSGVQMRSHTRRGHIRRLQSGKTTFVRPTIVGKSSLGFVEKTYLVNPRK